ncbi:MAG: substrate-binding domain-containing protein [Lachnospiraceae bacterium]|nr:substrate-binding domain-containing protein [Lachnospiraceae bacterium]
MTASMLVGCGEAAAPAAEAPAAEAPAAEEAAPAEAAAETPAADAAAAEAPAAGGEKYGVVLKTLGSEFWQSVQKGVEDKAAELGVEVVVQGANSEDDVEGQNNILETMVQSGEYVAFAVAPLSDANLVNTVAEANSQGYLVADIDEHINLDTLAAQGGAVVSFVTSDNERIGKMAGEYIASLLPDGGDVAIIEGKAGAISGENRKDGCKAAFEAAGLTIVDSQPADWDKTKAYDLATNLINKNENLKAIYCCNDTMAMGAYQAVSDSGKEILVVGTDGNADAVESVKAGGLTATIAQDSEGVGARSLELLVQAYRNGEKPGEKEIINEFVDPILITKD